MVSKSAVKLACQCLMVMTQTAGHEEQEPKLPPGLSALKPISGVNLFPENKVGFVPIGYSQCWSYDRLNPLVFIILGSSYHVIL